MYYIVSARYVKNTNEKLSPKVYQYIVNTNNFAYENLINLMAPNVDNPNQYIMWHIKNTSGEKSNPIIIMDCYLDTEEEVGYQEILKMEPAGIYDIETGIVKQKGELLNTDIMRWNNIESNNILLNQKATVKTASRYTDQLAVTSNYIDYEPNSLYFKGEDGSTISVTNASFSAINASPEQLRLEKEKYKIVEDNKYFTIVERIGKEEEDNMFNKMFKNIEFGKITDGSIKMSIYGPAFKCADGEYIAYANEDYIDATGFVFNDMDSFCFKMPVGEDNVDIDDFIVHNGKYCRVVDLDEKGNWIVEDVYAKEIKTIMSVRSPFGFNFLTKIITFGQEMFAADKENPFGSILPMMMLFGDSAKNDNSMMMAMMMMNNTNEIDPMMMYLMCGDSKNNKDLLPMLMMMNSKNNPFKVKPQHKCNCSCGEK